MAALELKLLGPFEARGASGEPVALPTRKCEAILAYAALAPGRPQPRDRLVNLLWSERGEDQARNSLRQALSAIRKALLDGGAAAPLVVERTTVEAPDGAVDVDALAFEALAMAGDPEALGRAAALYRGEFCEGMVLRDPAGEEWLAAMRERYRRTAVEVMERLLESHREAADTQSAVTVAERLVALDPLRESAWRSLMRFHAARGERNHALKTYRDCCDVLMRELGVEPEAATRDLYETIRAEDAGGSKTAPHADEATPDATPGRRSSESADRPSIAVLPFENLSGDPEQEYFSEGITEGIILGLSKFPSLTVKSRHSSFAFKNSREDVTEIGRLLNVRYVIEGSVRKTPDHVRITAQLVDAESGTQIWGQRYDSAIEGLFALEDELTRTIVATARGRIESTDQSVSLRRPAKDLRSYDYLMRGTYLITQFEPDLNPEGREMLQRCVELDPDNARAHAMLAVSYVLDWNNRWVEDINAALEMSGHHAEIAVNLSPEDTLGHAFFAEQLLFQQKYQKAEYHLSRARHLNPHDIEALAMMAFVSSGLGHIDEALAIAETIAGIDPYHPWIGWHVGIAFFTGRRYEDALKTFQSVPHSAYEVDGWMAATHEALGNHEQARGHMESFLAGARAEMAFFPATMEEMRVYWRDVGGYRFSSDVDHVMEKLIAAGLTAGDA